MPVEDAGSTQPKNLIQSVNVSRTAPPSIAASRRVHGAIAASLAPVAIRRASVDQHRDRRTAPQCDRDVRTPVQVHLEPPPFLCRELGCVSQRRVQEPDLILPVEFATNVLISGGVLIRNQSVLTASSIVVLPDRAGTSGLRVQGDLDGKRLHGVRSFLG